MVLKILLSQATKFLKNVQVSEAKVRQLTEQLAAANKVANANREALEKAKKQVMGWLTTDCHSPIAKELVCYTFISNSS